MADLKALIVAAGRGIRMGPRGEMSPKGLLKVGDVPLVRRSVQLLQARGIKSIQIVTGHLAEQYEAEFEGTDGVELLHNPDFATTGSLRSMMRGLEDLQGPFVMLESDLIYESAALDAVSKDQSRIIVSGPTGAGDEVYIWARSNAQDKPVFETMSKDSQERPDAPLGELMGILCFTEADTEALKVAGRDLLVENPKSDYESAVIKLAQTRDIGCHLIPDLAWTEIDDEGMFGRAVDLVWPAIRQRDAVRSG